MPKLWSNARIPLLWLLGEGEERKALRHAWRNSLPSSVQRLPEMRRSHDGRRGIVRIFRRRFRLPSSGLDFLNGSPFRRNRIENRKSKFPSLAQQHRYEEQPKSLSIQPNLDCLWHTAVQIETGILYRPGLPKKNHASFATLASCSLRKSRPKAHTSRSKRNEQESRWLRHGIICRTTPMAGSTRKGTFAVGVHE